MLCRCACAVWLGLQALPWLWWAVPCFANSPESWWLLVLQNPAGACIAAVLAMLLGFYWSGTSSSAVHYAKHNRRVCASAATRWRCKYCSCRWMKARSSAWVHMGSATVGCCLAHLLQRAERASPTLLEPCHDSKALPTMLVSVLQC